MNTCTHTHTYKNYTAVRTNEENRRNVFLVFIISDSVDTAVS